MGGKGEVALADGTSHANASLSLQESRKPGRPETQIARVYISVQSWLAPGMSAPSDFLRGHITAIELRDTQTPPRLLKSYAPPNPLELPPNLFGVYGTYDWLISVDDARALIVADHVVLEMQTDLASQPLVRIPLKGLNPTDPLKWSRSSIAAGDAC